MNVRSLFFELECRKADGTWNSKNDLKESSTNGKTITRRTKKEKEERLLNSLGWGGNHSCELNWTLALNVY